jgi:hypothetical protein
MKQIQLGSEVMVSDPCYTIGTWCQHKLTDVLPGEYHTTAFKSDNTDGWGTRCAALVAVHKDYLEDTLSWRTVTSADIGVDSGQCGIFSYDTYRKDEHFMNEVSEFNKTYSGWKDDGGEQWYGHMCDKTLSEDQWGTYSHGVVSSSGFGDGSYRLLVAKHNGKIVGIGIDYFVFKLKSSDFNLISQEEFSV